MLSVPMAVQVGAQALDTEGNARIRGRLDLGHFQDRSVVNIGFAAGINTDFVTDTTERGNTFVGCHAGFSNFTGVVNTAMGYHSLKDNYDGTWNTAMGTYALWRNISGSENTAVGSNALLNNSIGYQNTAHGSYALAANTTGYYNTGLGYRALSLNTTGVANTAGGYHSLYQNKTGSGNTAMGMQALYSDSIGSNNTALGYQSLYPNKTGSNNTAIGSNAYFTDKNLNNTTCIGFNAGRMANANNRIEIGNSSVSWIGGQVSWSTYSDARIKKQIRENVPGLSFITRLRPVTYHLDIHQQNKICNQGNEDELDWKDKYQIENTLMTGFVAQEVDRAAKEVDYRFSGVHQSKDKVGIYSLRYAEFVVPLVKAVQELVEQNSELRQLVQKQKINLDEYDDAIIALQEDNYFLKSQLSTIFKELGISVEICD